MQEIPNPLIREKILDIADKGNVISNNKSQSRQGFVFFKQDKKLSKYGSEYVCKIKVQGNGGDMRVLGKRVATGKIIKNGELTNKQGEIIEFDKVVHRGHK